MIPAAFITEWQLKAPWHQPDMVEQDLIICRTLVDLYSDGHISEHLAFRGGTALYKLYLLPPVRYSEDIDLVQVTAEPIGETIDRIHLILDPWLGNPGYDQTSRSFRLRYRYTADSGTQMRLKIEINTREANTGSKLVRKHFSVESRWYSESAAITTFSLAELLGTKLRALYQRKKGRDLFDINYALRNSNVNPDEVVSMFIRYVEAESNRISTSEFIKNLGLKKADKQFRQDILPLLRPGVGYDVDQAVELVNTELLVLIDDAWERNH